MFFFTNCSTGLRWFTGTGPIYTTRLLPSHLTTTRLIPCPSFHGHVGHVGHPLRKPLAAEVQPPTPLRSIRLRPGSNASQGAHVAGAEVIQLIALRLRHRGAEPTTWRTQEDRRRRRSSKVLTPPCLGWSSFKEGRSKDMD